MNISNVSAISFSPTKTSQKVVESVATAISTKINHIDLTNSAFEKITLKSDEIAIIGVPVYAGRVAPLAVDRLKQIKGSKTPAVIIVLYGNREYEDALIELKSIVEIQNFIPVAGAAFIGEHSFSTTEMPIASGRPDENDLSKAAHFGRLIIEKLEKINDILKSTKLEVPGNEPYKEGMGELPFTPKVSHDTCNLCGLCLENCPGDAISLKDEIIMDVKRCIFCCACIKICPEQAIDINAGIMLEKRQWLHENYSLRKEPELFF